LPASLRSLSETSAAFHPEAGMSVIDDIIVLIDRRKKAAGKLRPMKGLQDHAI
jgi:hypothetical protein